MIDVIPHCGGREAWRRARRFSRMGFRVLLWRTLRGGAAYMNGDGPEPYGNGRTRATDAATLASVAMHRREGNLRMARILINRMRYARGAASA